MAHAFVVPVYGQSPHLTECLDSLTRQSVRSSITLSTSTPSEWLSDLARTYRLTLFVHGPNSGIAHDWNMALSQVPPGCRWVTIAHQDDIYHPSFVEKTLAALERTPDALLAFTDYEEQLGSESRSRTPLLMIKRLLLEVGFLGRGAVSSRAGRRNCLRFGSPIPCPSVTIRRELNLRFDGSYGVNMDWAAWLELSEAAGSFVRVREILMAHRIHPESETTAAIAAGRRVAEDLRILGQLWPDWVARMIVSSYRLAYSSNRN